MRQSGRTTLFVLICIAVLCAAYGVGLGVLKLRMGGLRIQISLGNDSQKGASRPIPASRPQPKPPQELKAAATGPSGGEEWAADPAEKPVEAPATAEEPSASKDENEGGQDLAQENPQDAMAQRRSRMGGRNRGGGRGRDAYQQLSEEDRNSLREKMAALRARSEELSEEEMRQARNEILEAYGISPQAGEAGRPGGRQ